MKQDHAARPDGNWAAAGTPRCGVCAAPILEAVYSGGWLHAERSPHRFAPFVYGDGAVRDGGSCTACGQLAEDTLHA